ncbi:hypothetical protein SAMN02745133_02002 [Desulforamulus putei DSM 12395]|uniref:Uncharacterized protein n=1 Tax=Desulforamulus putei DSM 12395 TaxID=1121429 RepID=A0A1M4ZHN9_9FIRM|nr:hypothetical protein [Desulforamulus putei]SHF17322.1 hypothetical protein SAMN02745133_02002 [Desulforamulus putei DSM 12395]
MKRARVWLLVMLFLFSLCSAAYAEVTTFGFNDHRTRVAEGTEPVLWPAWKDDSGTSYSQPLILKGWGQFEGQTLVVAVTGNQLRGYVCKEPTGKIDESGFQQNSPLWSIPLMGDRETKSHPTLIKKDDGKRYIYIGTDKHEGKTGYLHIIDITDFTQAKKVYEFQDQWSSDIVSAPLVLKWRGHEVVVYTAGNTAEVHLATDPMDKTKANNIRIKVADSGRTSSSPAPVLNGQGFVVGLDRGPNGKGEFKIYRLDDILQEVNGKVELKSPIAYKTVTTHSSIVASFSVDGDWLYFGDQWSRVYGYNVKTMEGWINSDNYGTFSNRSPALTKNTVYFPAVGMPGQKGKLLSVDRNTHNTNWAVQFDSRAQTAPMVWLVPGIGARVLEGTGQGWLASIDPYTGVKASAVPAVQTEGGSSYGTGISGELSGSENWVVVTTEKGVKAWYAQPLDIEVVSLDPGCPKNAQGYIVKPGEKYKATAKIKANKLIIPGLPVPVGAFNELGTAAYKAVLKDQNGNELPRLSQINAQLNDDQYLVFNNQGEEITVTFEWTGAEKGTQHIAVGANLDYPTASPQLKNLWPETTLENNLKRVPIVINGYDAIAKIYPLKTEYIIFDPTVLVENTIITGRDDENPGTIPVRLTITGAGGTKTYNLNIGPKDYKKFPYNFTAGPGTYKIRAEAWPPNGEWTDIRPENNIAEVTIIVKRGKVPKGESGIGVGL